MLRDLVDDKRISSNLGKLSRDAETLSDSLTVFRINLVELLDHLLLNVSSGATKTAANIFNKVSSVSFVHDLSEESSGLLEIVIGMLMRVSASESSHREFNLLLAWILNRAIQRIGLIVGCASLVSIDGGRAIPLIVGNSSSVGAVDGNLIIVGTESVSVSVGVREKSALEHLVSRELNAWDNVSRGKSGLLNLGKVVFRVLV